MAHRYAVQFRDWSDELSSAEVNVGPITVLTIVAQLSAFAAFRTALEGITIGVAAKDRIVMDDTPISAARPLSENAQRERKWLVRYHGNTSTKKFVMEIPTADPVTRLLPGQDVADLTETNMAAFVTQFESVARSPDNDTENVTVDEIVLVGRNI